VDALERDALEVLSLVRSVKNSFAPINRIPPEILSLVPDYYDKNGTDRDLITSTHVCRGWREVFISRSSLWTRLDFTNAHKTQTYIQRSKSSLLEIHLEKNQDSAYLDNALSLATPRARRLKSLTIGGDVPLDAIGHFYCRAPLLEKLDISLNRPNTPVLNNALFAGGLSSLRELRLGQIITHLPWNNLANLTKFKLKSCPPGRSFVTRLLNFFECAPLLHTTMLEESIPSPPTLLLVEWCPFHAYVSSLLLQGRQIPFS
jgi:hypothetical protein